MILSDVGNGRQFLSTRTHALFLKVCHSLPPPGLCVLSSQRPALMLQQPAGGLQEVLHWVSGGCDCPSAVLFVCVCEGRGKSRTRCCIVASRQMQCLPKGSSIPEALQHAWQDTASCWHTPCNVASWCCPVQQQQHVCISWWP